MTKNAPAPSLVPFTLVQIAPPGQEPPVADVVTDGIAAIRLALEAARTRDGRAQALGEMRDLATSWQMLAITQMTPVSLGRPHPNSGKRYDGLPEHKFAGSPRSGTGIGNY